MLPSRACMSACWITLDDSSRWSSWAARAVGQQGGEQEQAHGPVFLVQRIHGAGAVLPLPATRRSRHRLTLRQVGAVHLLFRGER